jgi:hypothetical protein
LRHYPRSRSREHNLKGVTLGIPKNQITVFVGVSGFGKSSIVFDTIAVEAQRQLYATFPPFIRSQLPRHERPHVDAIENLTTPVIVDQRTLTGSARARPVPSRRSRPHARQDEVARGGRDPRAGIPCRQPGLAVLRQIREARSRKAAERVHRRGDANLAGRRRRHGGPSAA